MRSVVHFVLSLLMCLNGWSEPILFRASGSNDLEYRARLRVDEPFRTPTQAYLAQHPSAHSRDVLLARFARAQEAFVGNSIGEAKRHFQEVVAMIHADDWSTIDREVLLNAYLRLAQLETGAAERRHWLDQTQFLGPNLKVHDDLFPPPVMTAYHALVKGTDRLQIEPERTGWPLLLINGVPCRPRDCPSFPAAEKTVRVTFVSDQWIAQTMQVDLAQVTRVRPPRIDWVTGSCDHGGLSAHARELGEGRPFFGIACEGGPAAPATHAFAPVLAKHAVATSSLPEAAVTPPPAEVKRPFYKSKWLWAGVGVVAAGAIALAVANANRHHSGASAAPPPDANIPTTTYGF